MGDAKRFAPAGKGKGKGKEKLPIINDALKAENPETYYDFGEEIGRGKFAIVKKCTRKSDGKVFAAKIVKFDSDSAKFAKRELELMQKEPMNADGLAKLVDAYLVRKYLILIQDLIDGKTLVDYVAQRSTLNEEDVSGLIKQLCTILNHLHQNNILHLDLRPTNIRMMGKTMYLIDYNSCRHIMNKKSGEVVDVIGDTEFCAPEMLRFEAVQSGSDMWSVAINTYIMLSGISPFFYEDEDKVVASVQKVQWKFDPEAFASVSEDAKDFISKCLIRAPENRLTAEKALEHPWLSEDKAKLRKSKTLECMDLMQETDARLLEEEEEDYIWASCTFRTFEEEEYESPESSDEEEE
jgi:serine/threonine protein kinase